MNKNTKDVAFTGIYIGLILGIGYALAFIPNVELVTSMVFLSGVLMGTRRGLLIGCVGEFLFSLLNPVGSGILFPPMLIAQVLSMGLIGSIGGRFHNFVINWPSNLVNYLIIGSLGILLTIIYDIMVSIAFPIAAGFNVKAIAITLVTGVAFSAIYIFTNALVFIFVIPVTAQKVYSAIPYFREISNGK